MEIAILIKDIIVGLMWPLTILILFLYLKKPIIRLLDHALEKMRLSPGLRAKFGAFELDFETRTELKQQALLTADQPDPLAKLKKAKISSRKTTVIQELSEDDVKDLIHYQKTVSPHTFLADWWNMPASEKERLNSLIKKGMIGTYGIYNDEMCYFTPLGVEVLKTLGITHEEKAAEQNHPADTE